MVGLTSKHGNSVRWAVAVCLATAIAGGRSLPATPPTVPAEQDRPCPAVISRDIEYARVDGLPLTMDIHRPVNSQATADAAAPLVVYVHGGAWRSGSKAEVPVVGLIGKGFAIASVDYRLSPQARFPAQLHDIKAAIRFLRANAARLGVTADRLGIVGTSAGGHLAALVGVTGGDERLEGAVGSHGDATSVVQCVVSFYGAGNLQSILAQSRPEAVPMREAALRLLLGGTPDERAALAALASPITHLDAHDPPLLLIHGDADPQMPPEQSDELHRAAATAGCSSQLMSIHGGRHGGPEFHDAPTTSTVTTFLRKHLLP